MKIIKIREPIWKNLSVGIASRELTEDDIQVEITYKTKDGRRKWEKPFHIKKSIVEKFPIMERRGVKLHIIPISMMREMETV